MCIYTYTVYMLIIRTSRTYVNQITLVETLAILGQLVACVVLMVPFWCGWNPQKASAWLKSSILLVTYPAPRCSMITPLYYHSYTHGNANV